MSPEWLPESILLFAGLFAGAVALRLLFNHQPIRAMSVGAAGLALIVLAFLLGTSERFHTWSGKGIRGPAKPFVLLPATNLHPNENDSDVTASMSLRLGGVLLRVAPSDRYELSIEGEPFLLLDSLRSGMRVTCDVAGSRDRFAARIERNWLLHSAPGIQSAKPDAHTLLVQESGEDIFKVHYADPRTIEVMGRFYLSDSEEPVRISSHEGIHWKGGGVPVGMSIDLSAQGNGTIDFTRSGLIQIRRRSLRRG